MPNRDARFSRSDAEVELLTPPVKTRRGEQPLPTLTAGQLQRSIPAGKGGNYRVEPRVRRGQTLLGGHPPLSVGSYNEELSDAPSRRTPRRGTVSAALCPPDSACAHRRHPGQKAPPHPDQRCNSESRATARRHPDLLDWMVLRAARNALAAQFLQHEPLRLL